MTSPWDAAGMCGVIDVYSSDSEDYDYTESSDTDAESFREYKREWELIQQSPDAPQYLHYGRAYPSGPFLGEEYKGPFYEIFVNPPPTPQYWMQVFMLMKGFRMNHVFPFIDEDKRKRRTNDDGSPMIYLNIRCSTVTVGEDLLEQILFAPLLRKGRSHRFHGHITLARVYLDGLNEHQRDELQGLLWDIIGFDECKDLLEALSEATFKFDWMKWLNPALIEIVDKKLEDLLSQIISRTVRKLCSRPDVMGTENPYSIRSRFYRGRHPPHYRLEADTYIPQRRERITEWF